MIKLSECSPDRREEEREMDQRGETKYFRRIQHRYTFDSINREQNSLQHSYNGKVICDLNLLKMRWKQYLDTQTSSVITRTVSLERRRCGLQTLNIEVFVCYCEELQHLHVTCISLAEHKEILITAYTEHRGLNKTWLDIISTHY